MPKRNFRRSSTLAKRVKVLEQKQKADDNNTEFKVVYYNVDSNMDNSWGSNSNMAPNTTHGTDAEGDVNLTGNSRVGDQINLRHWTLEGVVQLPVTSDGVISNPNSSIPCRIILADNLTDNTALTAADVLKKTSSDLNTCISPYRNSAASGKKYRILMDKKIFLDSDKSVHHFKFKMKLPKSGRVLHYDDASVAPSDFNITLLHFANVSTLSSNKPKFTYFIKARYTDA